MLKFYITFDDKNQAQKQAGQLDVSHSKPPDKHPPHLGERNGVCQPGVRLQFG